MMPHGPVPGLNGLNGELFYLIHFAFLPFHAIMLAQRQSHQVSFVMSSKLARKYQVSRGLMQGIIPLKKAGL